MRHERTNVDSDETDRRHPRWFAAAAVVAVVLVGCGDDESAQDAYCEAGESLGSSVTALTDLDLISEGTSGLEAALDDVEADLGELSDSAADAAADEVDALEQAVDGLGTAISDLGGEISADNLGALQTAVQAIGSAVQGLADTLSDC